MKFFEKYHFLKFEMKFLFLKFEKMAIQEGNGKIEIFHLCHEKFDFFEKNHF
jgi:hypothetical protein